MKKKIFKVLMSALLFGSASLYTADASANNDFSEMTKISSQVEIQDCDIWHKIGKQFDPRRRERDRNQRERDRREEDRRRWEQERHERERWERDRRERERRERERRDRERWEREHRPPPPPPRRR